MVKRGLTIVTPWLTTVLRRNPKLGTPEVDGWNWIDGGLARCMFLKRKMRGLLSAHW